MVIGVLQLSLRFPAAESLKEKRRLLKSLVTRIRNKFNVSASEVEARDVWQIATLAVAHVGDDRSFTNRLLDQVLNFTERTRELEVIESRLEFL
jgi:hypothetical protein